MQTTVRRIERDTIRTANPLVAAAMVALGTQRIVRVEAHRATLSCGHGVRRAKARVGRYVRCEVCRAAGLAESQVLLG